MDLDNVFLLIERPDVAVLGEHGLKKEELYRIIVRDYYLLRSSWFSEYQREKVAEVLYGRHSETLTALYILLLCSKLVCEEDLPLPSAGAETVEWFMFGSSPATTPHLTVWLNTLHAGSYIGNRCEFGSPHSCVCCCFVL